jgi:hypothetical protein
VKHKSEPTPSQNLEDFIAWQQQQMMKFGIPEERRNLSRLGPGCDIREELCHWASPMLTLAQSWAQKQYFVANYHLCITRYCYFKFWKERVTM